MIFEFEPGPDFNFLISFAEKLSVPVHGNTLQIPATLGQGSIRIMDLSPDFKLQPFKMNGKKRNLLKNRPDLSAQAYQMATVLGTF